MDTGTARVAPLGVTKRLLLCALLGGALMATVGVGQAAADPPTPVTCGSLIAAPGQYFLAGDCAGPGIRITASEVHLKLEGHTMNGATDIFGFGIIAAAVSKLHIEGPGTITAYHSAGVRFFDVDNSRVQKVTATANQRGFAIFDGSDDNQFNNDVATGNRVGFTDSRTSGNNYVNVTASDNGGVGIGINTGSTATHIDGSTANDNGVFGIVIDIGSTGNDVHGNTALGQVEDLSDQNPGCDNNNWEGNHFVTSNQPCID